MKIMNNNIMLFKNQEFGEFEITIIDGKEYFPASQCAKILGYTNPNAAIIRHCKSDGITKREGVSFTTNQYGETTQQVNEIKYIDEGNLYRLIVRSKLELAQRFEKFIFNEVVPSIRKNGMYLTPESLHEALSNPKWLAEMLLKLDSEQKKRQEAEAENTFLSVKVKYLDQILQSKEAVQITKIAKDYGYSAITFNKLLHELGIQYPIGKTWVLYQRYADKGYTHSRTFAINEEKTVMHTYYTQKGRKFIYEFLKERGIVPLIEQE